MSKLHYTELFYSLQGEGKFTGVPSIFLRTFGCNFRCKNFGLDRDTEITGPNLEVEKIIKVIKETPSYYKTFADLPIVRTGCDSYSSAYPNFKGYACKEDPSEIVEKMLALLPNNRWVNKENNNDTHLVITGGEPLLGWQRVYPELIRLAQQRGLRNVTFETNGTQELTSDFVTYLFEEYTRFGRNYDQLTFSVSPKLPCSGEKWSDAIKPDVVREYELVGNTYLKFVVATEQDVEDVDRAVAEYRAAGFGGQVYLMPAGGLPEAYHLNTTQVAELALRKGYRYSPRLQVDIWRNAWGT